MAVADFLIASLREFQHGNYHAAMACVCIAVDATAKSEFGGSSKARCLAFVDAYLDVITKVGLANAVVAGPGSTLKLRDPLSPGKTKRIQDIIYESIRCALIHEANLPIAVSFTEQAFYGFENSTFKIPTRMIIALFLAAIVSPANSGGRLPLDLELNVDGCSIRIVDIAAKPVALRALLQL
jgi:hypothetical protein